MTRKTALHQIAKSASVAAACFVAGELGLLLIGAHGSAAGVWPCAGLAVAGLLIFGYSVWPAILVGSFLCGLAGSSSSLTASAIIATMSTLEALGVFYLVRRFARGRDAFERASDIFKFASLTLAATAIGSAVGAAALVIAGLSDWAAYPASFAAWWLGDAVGVLTVTPLLLFWWDNPKVKWTREQGFELTLLLLGIFCAAFVIFGGVLQPTLNHGLAWLCVPFFIWAAFRFGKREAATALFLLSAVAICGTAYGLGPFAAQGPNRSSSQLPLQIFLGTLAVTVLALAAEVSERRRAEQQVRDLAISDSLTGLANYRQLIEALESEIKRFGRTERPFAILLLDLDGLKKINDAHGHVAGSRALCRLADTLRLYSREMDTAARYGGDEFVLILPETDGEAGRLVAQRISKRLAEDGEEPKLSVSIGMAVCPDDGETIHEIMNAADHDLHREKGVPKKKFVLPS
jgi:diguanylate cyclase (GGDEF)-like protein